MRPYRIKAVVLLPGGILSDLMHVLKKRRIAALLTVLAVLVAAVVAGFGAAAGDTERISSMWISARLQPSGLAVTEVIDYDFGPQIRHGIFRDIPDLAPGSRVEVVSPTAPDTYEVISLVTGTRIKIGDALQTISGRHRYRIDYTLDRSAVLNRADFAWDAVGNEWTVGIANVDLHVDLGSGAKSMVCTKGTAWSSMPCAIQSGPGDVGIVHVDQLDQGDGLTVYAVAGSVTSDLPAPPSGPASDPGTGVWNTVWLAAVAALAAAAISVFLVRRAGREQVWSGGATVAAFGPDNPDAATERIDERRLGQLATTEFESPRGMSAVEGAVLIDETVKDHHLAAWLLESAVRGEIEIEGQLDDATLMRTDVVAHPTAEPVLRRMFNGRQRISLGEYDSQFASGWQLMKDDVTRWQRGATFWDRSGHKRRTTVRVIAGFGLALGLTVTAIGSALANRRGTDWLPIVAAGAVLIGLCWAAVINSWELLIRSPGGTARWLQVESFRRFLHESEAQHVEQAAKLGLLRQYTAWAVALDEADRWTLAVSAANRADPTMRTNMVDDFAFVALGSSLGRSVRSAHTQPSSSGGGGGGGFSAGGGGGGGGGGSW